ncbi:MAG: NapC/NirT family cytochrome c [Candidatus Zixiibacteriota bacterium]|nr:MAG: NapC/NirT family cytochrome c [candidate division Zixibacteria bacterium]
MRRLRLPRLAYNWISSIGIAIALVIILLMTFLYVIDLFASETNPYLGIFLYMALPPILIFGLLLIPIGMIGQWLRFRKSGELAYPSWPYIDLNNRSHRNATLIFFSGTFLFLIISAVGSYKAYHFTESVTFCGTTCHKIMKPEHTAYQNSPHARVACVACHVGPGADWFAKSKLSGLYQVYATLLNKYPSPIPTPIASLRPARETCEQCHWPKKFFGAQQRLFKHYMYDKDNTYWPINVLVNTGGGGPGSGEESGIHWHTFISNRIEYIARDQERLDIPWIRATNLKTGRITIYQNIEDPLSEEEIAAAAPRVLDCMDCHNRPSHIYNSPDNAINTAIYAGWISALLPEIKRISVEAMAIEYEDEAAARQGIANYIGDFYLKEYPDIHDEKPELINQAILATQDQFTQNIFPEMKVRWEEYPNNIGHFESPGCFRCHFGSHTSADGVSISKDCNACHIIFAQGSGDRASFSSSPEGLAFVHPEDIDDAWQEIGCFECHSGTQP